MPEETIPLRVAVDCSNIDIRMIQMIHECVAENPPRWETQAVWPDVYWAWVYKLMMSGF